MGKKEKELAFIRAAQPAQPASPDQPDSFAATEISSRVRICAVMRLWNYFPRAAASLPGPKNCADG
jgi:hypothetical protein